MFFYSLSYVTFDVKEEDGSIKLFINWSTRGTPASNIRAVVMPPGKTVEPKLISNAPAAVTGIMPMSLAQKTY
nr:hypothetical protein [Methylomarinum sp. Ch1-1]MDP4523243.1 hypothetical protein [Methylomarinum sp. Ch1-1]